MERATSQRRSPPYAHKRGGRSTNRSGCSLPAAAALPCSALAPTWTQKSGTHEVGLGIFGDKEQHIQHRPQSIEHEDGGGTNGTQRISNALDDEQEPWCLKARFATEQSAILRCFRKDPKPPSSCKGNMHPHLRLALSVTVSRLKLQYSATRNNLPDQQNSSFRRNGGAAFKAHRSSGLRREQAVQNAAQEDLHSAGWGCGLHWRCGIGSGLRLRWCWA